MATSLGDPSGRRPRLRPLLLRDSSGSTATVHPHGAHATSWIPADSGEVFYPGAGADFEASGATRGGVPVVFPQFGIRGPLPPHGFVRKMLWTAEDRAAGDSGVVTFRLEDDEYTRSAWPFRFAVELHVCLAAHSLRIELRVTNTGVEEMPFTCGLHSYFRVGDVRRARIDGVGRSRYSDKLAGGTERVQETDELAIAGVLDRVYLDPPASVSLIDPLESRRIQISSSGFANLVVWNPWGARIAEFSGTPPDDYLRFVCIEGANVMRDIVLAPGDSWAGNQDLLHIHQD